MIELVFATTKNTKRETAATQEQVDAAATYFGSPQEFVDSIRETLTSIGKVNLPSPFVCFVHFVANRIFLPRKTPKSTKREAGSSDFGEGEMLNVLHASYELLAKGPPVTQEQISVDQRASGNGTIVIFP